MSRRTGGLADDGKRLDSLSPRWTLYPGGWMPQPHTLIFLLFIFPKWGEVRRGEIAVISEPVRGLADDGKRREMLQHERSGRSENAPGGQNL